jgi:type IV pilus assembly protein PilW
MRTLKNRVSAALQAGFTLVEVMIALMIGMIGIVVMMQVFSVSEGFKRTATTGTDAQVNGAVAMYMIEREIRTSGYNLNDLMSKGCPTVRLWWNASASGLDLRLIPTEINPANVPPGDANTDTIQIAFGTADSSVSGVPVSQPPAIIGAPMDPLADFKLLSGTHDTFKAGDLVVAVQPMAAGQPPSCVIHELTKVYQASGNCGTPSGLSGLLEHKTAPYKSAYQACGIALPVHNAPAPGIRDTSGAVVPGLDANKGGMLYNLGGLPAIHVWAIRNGNLTQCDWSQKDCTKISNYDVMVNDIVSLRAVYAMAVTPADLTKPPDLVTVQWNRNLLTTNNLLPTRVVAVAFEIVARSNLKEKSTTNTTCDATADKSRPDKTQDWMYQGMGGAGIDLSSVSADWNCYRYKLYQTRVPVRNTLWRPS